MELLVCDLLLTLRTSLWQRGGCSSSTSGSSSNGESGPAPTFQLAGFQRDLSTLRKLAQCYRQAQHKVRSWVPSDQVPVGKSRQKLVNPDSRLIAMTAITQIGLWAPCRLLLRLPSKFPPTGVYLLHCTPRRWCGAPVPTPSCSIPEPLNKHIGFKIESIYEAATNPSTNNTS